MNIQFQLIKDIYVYEAETEYVDDIINDMLSFFSYELVTRQTTLKEYLMSNEYCIRFFETDDCTSEMVSFLNNRFNKNLDGFLSFISQISEVYDIETLSDLTIYLELECLNA